MQFEEKTSLSKLRLASAENCLRDAKVLIDSGSFKSSANRSYYAVFHAMRAILVFNDFDSKKHSGIISEFRKEYIKTGKIKPEISKIIDLQFSVRTHSDYDDFYMISQEEALQQLNDAKTAVNEIKKLLNDLYRTE